jgi:hypothetical protein
MSLYILFYNLFIYFKFSQTEEISFFLVKRVPVGGLEQRESGKNVLYLQIVIILIS